jgi:hypothetical protein
MHERLAQCRQPEWLPHHEGMQRNRHDQRLREALFDHFIKTIDDHVGKIPRRAFAVDYGR